MLQVLTELVRSTGTGELVDHADQLRTGELFGGSTGLDVVVGQTDHTCSDNEPVGSIELDGVAGQTDHVCSDDESVRSTGAGELVDHADQLCSGELLESTDLDIVVGQTDHACSDDESVGSIDHAFQVYLSDALVRSTGIDGEFVLDAGHGPQWLKLSPAEEELEVELGPLDPVVLDNSLLVRLLDRDPE